MKPQIGVKIKNIWVATTQYLIDTFCIDFKGLCYPLLVEMLET